jgi:LPS-assembly protein
LSNSLFEPYTRRLTIKARRITPRTCFSVCLSLVVVLHANLLLATDQFIKSRSFEQKGGPWQIVADKLTYNEKEGVYTAEGNVVITGKEQVLSAQKAIYDEKTGIVEVSGDVALEVRGDTLKADRAIFDLNTNTGHITKGRLFLRKNHFYISGENMERTGPDTYNCTRCRITTCDDKIPDWSISGSEVKVTLEGYGTIKNPVFRIHDLPSFYFPYGFFPAKTERQSGLLLPRVGESDLNGIEIELPVYWAITDQMDATFYEHYMSNRGLMQGFEYRYVADEKSRGSFLFDILKDRIEEKDLSNSDQAAIGPFPRTNDTRYWLRGRTDQTLPLGMNAKLDLDYVSDQDYLREFQTGLFGYQARPDLASEFGRPLEETISPYRRSTLRLDRDGQDYSVQGRASYFEEVENPDLKDSSPGIGGVDFSLLPRPLFSSPLFFKFQTDYNYLWRKTGITGQQFSFTPTVSYPMWLGRYLEFEPSLAYGRDTQWMEDPVSGNGSQARDVYDFETRLTTNLERVFDIQWGEVTKLMHKASPSLIFSYREYRTPDYYQYLFEPSNMDGRFNQIALDFDNLFNTREENKKGEITYGQWGRIDLVQGYNIEKPTGSNVPENEKRDFLPLVGFLSVSPLYPLTLQAEADWDHYERDFTYANTSLEFRVKRSGGKYDSYGVEYLYLKDGNKGFNFNVNINLLYGFSVGISEARDLRADNSVGQSYWLDYQSQCWGVRVMGQNVVGLQSFMIMFRLGGLGELGMSGMSGMSGLK